MNTQTPIRIKELSETADKLFWKIQTRSDLRRKLSEEIKGLREELNDISRLLKNERRVTDELRGCEKWTGIWLDLFNSGMTSVDICALLNIDKTHKEIAILNKCSPSWSRSCRSKAIRKINHPLRRQLKLSLGDYMNLETLAA